MVVHAVMLKPRADLSSAGRDQLIAAFERAVTEIPTVRHFRVGRRIVHGAGYEAQMPDTADFLVMIEFDDAAGLDAYLRHPSHTVGTLFTESLAGALVYDFEDVGLESLR